MYIVLVYLDDIGIDREDRRLIKQLYIKQKVVVRIDKDEMEEMGIGKGVNQRCCLSPALSNIHDEKLTEKALEKYEEL